MWSLREQLVCRDPNGSPCEMASPSAADVHADGRPVRPNGQGYVTRMIVR